MFTGAGTVEVSTNSQFNGSFTSGNLQLVAGILTGNAAVAQGQVDWAAGTLAGTWTVAAGHSLDVVGPGGKTISGSGTVLTNAGTVNWRSGNISVASGAEVVNDGLWDAQADGSLVYPGGGATFINSGTLRKSGGEGTTTLSGGLGFTNPGVMDARTGTIAIGTHFVNTGTMMGDGRYAIGGTLTNDGTVAPGSFGAGSLDIAAQFVQGGDGVLALDLASLASFDLLAVTGTAQLGGTLALHCLGACSFEVGDSFTVLTSTGARSGSFGALSLSGFATGQFDVIYDSHSVSLLVTEAVTPVVPEPGTWGLLAAGLAVLAFRARRQATQGDA